MPYMENHTLYYKKQCPFCQKVLRFMDDNKITMDTRDTLQPGNQNDLVRIGGKKQVPCLVIGNKPMYESDFHSTCAIDRPHSLRAVFFHAEAFCSSSLPRSTGSTRVDETPNRR